MMHKDIEMLLDFIMHQWKVKITFVIYNTHPLPPMSDISTRYGLSRYSDKYNLEFVNDLKQNKFKNSVLLYPVYKSGPGTVSTLYGEIRKFMKTLEEK